MSINFNTTKSIFLFRLKSGWISRNCFHASVLFFALGMFGYALRSVGYFSAVPGDFGDDRFNSVILEHVYRWLTGHEISIWNPTFFYPFEHVLAFGDNHFGSAIFYALLRFSGLSRELAFDGWFLIGITLNYVCSYLAFRRIGFLQLPSAAGAFVFCFSLPVLRLEIHAQLIYRFAIPLAFAAFWKFLTTNRLFLLWQVIICITIQFLCSIYLGVFLIYLLSATFLAWLIIVEKGRILADFFNAFKKETRGSKVFFCVSIVVSVSILAWLLYHYYSTMLEYPLGPLQTQLVAFLPRFSFYFSPDRQMFFGFGIWILCFLGVFKAFQKKHEEKIGIIAVISFLALFVATLNIHDHSLYRFFSHLPGISVIRAVVRIVLVMLLPIGILVAVSIQAIQNKAINTSTSVKALLMITMLCLLGTEVLAYKPKNTSIVAWQSRKTVLLEKMPSMLPSHPILYVTMKIGEPHYMAELDGMILAQDLGIPTLNGYSGNVPPGYSFALPCVSYHNRLRSYAAYRTLPLSKIDPIAKRVVTISLTPCIHEPIVGFSVDLNPVHKEKNTLAPDVDIRN